MTNLYPFTNPALDAGEYVLDIYQGMSNQNPANIPTGLMSQAENRVEISVDGPRLRLTDGEVLTRSPARDEPMATPLRVPSLVLKQDSLPWQRSVIRQSGQSPAPDDTWLYLLILPEDEIKGWVPPPGTGGDVGATERMTPGKGELSADVKEARGGGVAQKTSAKGDTSDVGLPGSSASPHQAQLHLGKPLSAIPQGVPASVGAGGDTCDQVEMTCGHLKSVLPSRQELKDLVHVRQLTQAEATELEDDDGFVAVVLANRVLKPSQKHLALLISLQDQDPWDLANNRPSTEKIRLISLYHWRFRAGTTANDFQHLVQNLDTGHWGQDGRGEWIGPLGDWIPLEHRGRGGEPGKSAFKGPLVHVIDPAQGRKAPAIRLGDIPTPTVYLPGHEPMSEITEQAAFELGRLLALSDQSMLSPLMGYRRAWQQAAAWAVQRAESQLASQSAGAQYRSAAGGDWGPLAAMMAPIPGLAERMSAPVSDVVDAAALELQADPSGVEHLANQESVPGMDLETLNEAKGLDSPDDGDGDDVPEGFDGDGGDPEGSSITQALSELEGASPEPSATERKAAPAEKAEPEVPEAIKRPPGRRRIRGRGPKGRPLRRGPKQGSKNRAGRTKKETR